MVLEMSSENQLEIIGAGFGRTGTLSLRAALDRLGLGPIHHMFEVIAAPEQSPDWVAAQQDKQILKRLLASYRSAVDWPSCYFWKELLELYPDAKVILSHRESKGWYKSIHSTLYQFLSNAAEGPGSDQLNMARELVADNTFAGRLGEEDYAIEVYERHNEMVKSTVPSERLLVFDVREGWQPLCEFLGRPVPDEPFPRTNSAEELMKNFKGKPPA